MNPVEILQLIRVCDGGQVWAQLQTTAKKNPQDLEVLYWFFLAASRRKKPKRKK